MFNVFLDEVDVDFERQQITSSYTCLQKLQLAENAASLIHNKVQPFCSPAKEDADLILRVTVTGISLKIVNPCKYFSKERLIAHLDFIVSLENMKTGTRVQRCMRKSESPQKSEIEMKNRGELCVMRAAQEAAKSVNKITTIILWVNYDLRMKLELG